MKKILFIVLAACFSLPSAAGATILNDADAYQTAASQKLGAMSDEAFKPPKDYDGPTKDPTEDVVCEDPNCAECDPQTGKCKKCSEDRYLEGDLCFVCPEKHYCDGIDAVPNCQNVSCTAGNVCVANDTGACCVEACSGVVCNSGYSPVPSADGCCCK